MKNKIEVACPKCGKKFSYYSSEFRPFCTKKCKMIDLGHWFEESYNIKGRDNSVYIEDPDKLKDLLNEDY
ncbi:MAG: DNA gyrase inhibitor YacG [Halobacteriovoraceae bacterium]|nr:DNA gyrase inhibitor YacG [Halobacteriovoraceae bacterium]|tara:strand:+ start:45885 stop:46094 length:210 start_codon:yes stop_codon:yes gene_type:complete